MREARDPKETPTETMMRALSEMQDDAEIVVVIALSKDGYSEHLYSNARSEPEMNGMLWQALEFQENLADEED